MPVALEPVPSMPPLVVIAHDDPGTADSLRHAVESTTGWQVVMADPSPAGLSASLVADPSVALIGCAALGNLPADCRTPIVAIGDDDRPADDGAADLPGELARVAVTGQPGSATGHSGLVVATRGVQGGAGTTTVAIHLAAAWARWGPTPVLLMDLSGGLAFRLDLGAVPTWSTLAPFAAPPRTAPDPSDGSALEPLVSLDLFQGSAPHPLVGAGDPLQGSAPPSLASATDPIQGLGDEPLVGLAAATAGRLDPATLVGTLAEPWAGLLVLPLAGLADGAPEPPPDPRVVQGVLQIARAACRVVIVDLPATDGPLVEPVLSQADALVAVGRCETAGVRGLQAAIEAWTASGHDLDTAGAVVTGVRPQAPLAPREVRAALGDRLWALIPTAAAELAAAAEDGILLLDRHDLPAVQAMVTLANRVAPFAAVSA
jgi:cellulose biosynthesis protein BcsQ